MMLLMKMKVLREGRIDLIEGMEWFQLLLIMIFMVSDSVSSVGIRRWRLLLGLIFLGRRALGFDFLHSKKPKSTSICNILL